MLKIIFSGLFIVAVLLFIRPFRVWFLEELKELSDRLLLLFLSLSSGFESELTQDGKTDQRLWREQRLRNLRSLRIRSQQRLEKSQSDVSERS